MIDVSDILLDPDFVQILTIYRRAESVGSNGVVSVNETLISPSPVGSIQSGANPELLRQADMQSAANLITVYTRFALQGPAPGYQPDSVAYKGDRYEVFLVNDWSDYGQGFVQALCRSISSIDGAPL